MMISTRGRYALRVMLDLAENNTGKFIPLKEIAERQSISEKYLESIIAVLVKADFLTALRGKGGGYKLKKAPSQYSVGSILTLTEGSLAPVACLETKPNKCKRANECKTLPMWEKLDRLINDFFDGITICDLIENESKNNFII